MASTSLQGCRLTSEMDTLATRAALPGCSGPSLQRSLYNKCHSRPQRQQQQQRMPRICASSAAPYGPAGGGNSEIVDANMSVLRKRIHRLRSLESMEGLPEEWMEWEKSCYASYRADVAYMMAGLQSQLMGIRPSVSLFILSVLLSAVPVVSLLMIRFVLQYWAAHS